MKVIPPLNLGNSSFNSSAVKKKIILNHPTEANKQPFDKNSIVQNIHQN